MRPTDQPSENPSPYDTAEPAKGSARQMQLAEARTKMAEDRTIMAVERTFAGWIRTAFGAIAIGLGFRALFGELEPTWLAKAIATLFILMSIWMSVGAANRACDSLGKMHEHAFDGLRQRQLRWIAYAVAAGAALLVLGLWVFNDGNLGS